VNKEINTISDKELVKRCIAYERKYQEMLYRKYADKMYSVAMIYSNNNEDDASDILQNGFIQVFKKIHTFKFNGSLESWIRRIIVNKAIELYRKKVRERDNIAEYKTFAETETEGILGNINADDLIKLVNSLPSKASVVLKLFAVEGYSHKEIAEKLKIKEGTSKSQLNRARHLLKEAISKQNG